MLFFRNPRVVLGLLLFWAIVALVITWFNG
jgi:hypothetical protein